MVVERIVLRGRHVEVRAFGTCARRTHFRIRRLAEELLTS